MIDDLVGVSEMGQKAVQLNDFINVKTAEKKLQFGHKNSTPLQFLINLQKVCQQIYI